MALKEVCIAARPSQSGNTLEGDIIVIRDPRGEIGTKERGNFLWLLIDESELPPCEDCAKDNPERANISLDSIKGKHPSLDLDMVRSDQEYQPFVNPHPVTGRFQARVPVGGVAVSKRNNSNSPLLQQRLLDQIRNR